MATETRDGAGGGVRRVVAVLENRAHEVTTPQNTVWRQNATHAATRDRWAWRRSTWERLLFFCRSRPSLLAT